MQTQFLNVRGIKMNQRSALGHIPKIFSLRKRVEFLILKPVQLLQCQFDLLPSFYTFVSSHEEDGDKETDEEAQEKFEVRRSLSAIIGLRRQ